MHRRFMMSVSVSHDTLMALSHCLAPLALARFQACLNYLAPTGLPGMLGTGQPTISS